MTSFQPTAAGARLRKTFRYPDDDDNSDPEAMDEEEQKNLITALAKTNAAQNDAYVRALLVLPALSALPCLLALARFPATLAPKSIFALTSLSTTALQLRALPPTRTGLNPLDGMLWRYYHSSSSSSRDPLPPTDQVFRGSAGATGRPKGKTTTTIATQPFEPLGAPQCYIAPLNLLLLALTTLSYLLLDPGSAAAAEQPLRQVVRLLPPVVYLFVQLAKVIMASVDPAAELEGLRYEYKGA